ncbi:MAG TPA: caspase family protein [Woeseiaceae bacterium]|nr:caspase family protein [Woeseiaceae bacterium]
MRLRFSQAARPHRRPPARELRGRIALTLTLAFAGSLQSCAAAPAEEPRQPVEAADRYLVVDCLLPGQVRRIGNRYSFSGPRRPVRTTASECAIRGGEYVAYDRADFSTSKALWEELAAGGDAEAQNYLGEIYEKGLGTAVDYQQAKTWYERAAAQDLAAAQFNLGKLYETGLLGEADPAQALSWYRKASGLPELRVAPELQPAELPGEFPGNAGSEANRAPSIEMIDPAVPDTRGVTPHPVAAGVRERLIIGRVTPASALRSVTVNDESVAVEDSGVFQSRVAIGDDGTLVTIVAVDSDGRRGTRSFRLDPRDDDEAPLRVATEFGAYHALVIGIDDYEFMNPLQTAVNDAGSIREVLVERFGFRVRYLEDPTRNEILEMLNTLRKELTEKDNLLIYYAGHGTLEEVNDRGYWLPRDAKPDDNTNWIPNYQLTDLLNIMSARHVLVISDSCYSGTITRSSATALRTGRTREQVAADYAVMNEKRSRTALTSGGLQPVLDQGRDGHSVFASALLDALNDVDQVVDAQSLLLQIRSLVAQSAYDRERFEQVPTYGPINFARHEFGEFLFVPRQELTGRLAPSYRSGDTTFEGPGR